MFDLIIVGGGMAAFSAAIYASRRGLKTLVIGKDVGGQANFTDQIENYPGVKRTGGYELVANLRDQAESFGAKYLEAEVTRIKQVSGSFVLTAYSQQYKASSVILAYGKTPRDLGVDGEEEFKGKGVSYCATCDASLFKNKIVAVAGVGDLALDAALLLSKFAKKVYYLAKSEKLIGHPGLLKALGKKENIEVIPFVQILEIGGSSKLEHIKLLSLRHNSKSKLLVDGLFVELGYVVKSDLVKGLVELDDLEQIVIQTDQSTSVPGIFAAGDATNRLYKQAVISAGEGATAALAAFDWLARQKGGKGLTSDWTQIKRVKS